MTSSDTSDAAAEWDVAVVGGGPAGCSAGVFAAREGLDTVVFDCGRSSLQQCAHLENYLGFPAGIDVETFYALAHDHAEEAGCELVPEFVESVAHADDGGFILEPQSGEPVRATRVVAATRYDADYLQPLDADGEMYETHEHGGEEQEYFDRTYADDDGRTPIDGLYVASPVEEWSTQAIAAAGFGALVGRHVVGDARREQGYPEGLAERVDWLRQERARDEEWADPDRWREYFDEHVPEDHDLADDELIELREAEVDDRLGRYVDDEEIDRRRQEAHDRILEHLDDDRIRAYLDRADDDAP
ncbi:NAD(P)/FAD-dependent oxidoreductase [Halobacterium noricense]|uniref:NAD(P)/FAD-dependent oxidoreductase n=1 Tax=Halobacterium noricense TaxID=223182 RepID=UPI001E3134AA|nr:FAD-binding protein [Halobacterium noricense]UHH24496.1 FAD-binding protein [Halobacterium noricense]